MIEVSFRDDVRVIRFDAGENSLNGPFVSTLTDALAEASDPGGPLVITGTGKFFCNGLDLEWLSAATPADAERMLADVHAILATLLRFPGATVAAINGHAFGAGAILAAAADYRIQRSDRGFFCLPEVDLGLAMSNEFDAVLRAKLPAATVLDALLSGRRYGAEAALAAGIVHATATDDALIATAVDLCREHVGKSPTTVAALKAQQHKAALAVLDSERRGAH